MKKKEILIPQIKLFVILICLCDVIVMMLLSYSQILHVYKLTQIGLVGYVKMTFVMSQRNKDKIKMN